MGLSINPLDIIKTFRERGIRGHKRIADYLDVIANVATSLANTWNDIYHRWVRDDNPDKDNFQIAFVVAQQRPIFYEASEYYKRASAVLGKKLTKSQMEELFDALGMLLSTRNRTKRLYELEGYERDEKRRAAYFSSGALWHESIALKEMEENIDAMQREAATLRALASSIRAQP